MLWKFHTPKVFHPITQTIFMTLQRVDFGKVDAYILTLSLNMEDNSQKAIRKLLLHESVFIGFPYWA